MSIYAGVGKSSSQDYNSALSEAIYQAKSNLKQPEISLAIIFTSPEFAHPHLLKKFRNMIGEEIPVLGVTSNAIFTDDQILNHGVIIALIGAKETYFNIALATDAVENLEANGNNLGKQLLFGMRDIRRRFCLFFSDALIMDNLPFLKGLQQRLGMSFPMFGATPATNNIRVNKTYQYFNQEVLNNSIVGLLWAGNVNFGLGIKHGWKPLGRPRRVSVSDGFVIKEIEQRAAASLYQDYFAKDVPALKRELKRISCLYPLGINISGEEEYLLRNILSIRDDGSLICRGDVPVGSQVRLMIATKESCLVATEDAAREAKQAFALQTMPKPETIQIIFVFNSASRLYLLGRQITKELEIIKSFFPDTPIIGLCTFGEQAPLKTTYFAGKTYCHNQTIAIIAIG